jgi:hypothetical protein
MNFAGFFYSLKSRVAHLGAAELESALRDIGGVDFEAVNVDLKLPRVTR